MNTWSAHHHVNPTLGRLRGRPRAISVLLGLAASVVIGVGATDAQAVTVETAPVWPVADVIAGPPPIPEMPTAGEAPPDDQIADPITAGAVCSGWHLQDRYGDRWSAGSTWWEYQCTYDASYYYNPCPGPACPAFCPECYWELQAWTDYFYWNGSSAVFYGEAYYYSIVYVEADYSPPPIDTWWDAPTARWYKLGYLLTVSKQGGGDGVVTSTPAGIDCGDTCQATFDGDNPSVTLTATPDPSSIFAGWGGDCSGTGGCQVTMDRTRSVTAHFYPNVKELTVYKQGTGSGTVTSTPAGIDCANTCHASFATGSAVTLTATADPSSTFTGWSGDCTGTGTCQVTMDGDRWVSPTFATIVPNQPPTPRFTFSCLGVTCRFDGSASTDSDGTIVAYHWDFGDQSGTSHIEPTDEHTYYQAGTYNVALTVVDDGGASATSPPQAVTATNAAPTASFTFNCTNLTCSFDGRRSADSDGTIVSYRWDFGDASPPAGGSTAEHTYATAGTYTVTLTVIDNGHLSASASQLVTVPPTVPGAPQSVTARANGTTAEVRFSAPVSDGGSPITGYTARCASSNGGVTRQAQGPASPVYVPKLSGGKTYTCTVWATNAVGTGPPSAPSAPFRVPR